MGNEGPDSTAVRVALWRAQHVEVDARPLVFEDEIGLRLAPADENWRARPDMDAERMRLFRASIVGRARFVEDLVVEQIGRGVRQYVILGAGLDTFAQRRGELASKMRVFEFDQPRPQAWKERRLEELGFGVPEWLRLVPVNFEAGDDWLQILRDAGFDVTRPAMVASTGVSMYLTKDAMAATMRQVATLATGSTFAMTFLLPTEYAEPELQPILELAAKSARESGTPFLSYFTPQEMMTLAREAGFRDVEHVSAVDLTERFFAGRTDGLRPPKNCEEFLVGRT